MHRANYALRGIPLAAGEHVVQFRYRPRSVAVGRWVSAAGIAAMAGLGVAAICRRPR